MTDRRVTSPGVPSRALALALLGASLAAQDYDLDVLARTGTGPLTQISFYVSINDDGLVAFPGAEANGTGVWVCDQPGNELRITFNPSSTRRFDGASLTNEPPFEVATRDQVTGSSPSWLPRRWPTDASQSWQLIGRSPQDFESASPWLEVNDSGVVAAQVIVNGNQRALLVGSNSSPTIVAAYSTLAKVHPQISNDNRIVHRGDGSDLVVHQWPAGTADTIGGFAMVGSDPGISPDGRVVAFAGDRGNGEGLFVAIRHQQVWNVFRIAGEGLDGFTDFDEENQRVGVVNNGEPDKGGMSMAVCAVGTWNGVQGLYTIDVSAFTDAGGALVLQAETPQTVAQIGDTVAGGSLVHIQLSDPINGYGEVAFRAGLASGDAAVVRATRKPTMVRVSVKRVLGPGGQAPGWPMSRVQTWLADASAALEKHLRVRLDVVETIDLPDRHAPSSWFDVPDSSSVPLMEAVAELQPCDYAWRPDALNVYLVDDIGGAAGVCSFPLGTPPDANDLIVLSPSSSSSGGVALAHEIGHWLNLRHTHANFESAAGGCPGGACGDCVDDTADDTDPSLCATGGFACHNANLIALGYPEHVEEMLLYNVMSYHGPLTVADARLSGGQVLRARDGLRRFRRHAISTETAPAIAMATPSRGAYPGPMQIAVDGSAMPTAGQLELWVGKLSSTNLAVNTPVHKQAVFNEAIEPGDHCVFLRQDGQLVAMRAGALHVTPSIAARVVPSPFFLELTFTTSAPSTPIVYLLGPPGPAVTFPGILFRLDITPLPLAIPLTTGANGEIVIGLPIAGLASGSRISFQAVEVTLSALRFTNAAHVAVP